MAMSSYDNVTGTARKDALKHSVAFTGGEVEALAPASERHKDTLFRDLFGSPERKDRTLSLYNALNGTAYTDPDELEMTTLDGVLYLNMHNDVSFLINDEMTLWEHQSTYNPNMPLRGLLYFTQLYAAHVVRSKMSLFARRRIMLPTPRFVVFYIGRDKKDVPDVLRLSDSFSSDEFDLEVTATVIDINPKSGAEVLGLCDDLAGYSSLVGKVRDFAETMQLDDAVEAAVNWCIDRGILKEYLLQKRAEVMGMLLTEYNEAREREYLRREAMEDGFQDGFQDGKAKGFQDGLAKAKNDTLAVAASMVSDGIISLEEAAKRFGFSADEIERARL